MSKHAANGVLVLIILMIGWSTHDVMSLNQPIAREIRIPTATAESEVTPVSSPNATSTPSITFIVQRSGAADTIPLEGCLVNVTQIDYKGHVLYQSLKNNRLTNQQGQINLQLPAGRYVLNLRPDCVGKTDRNQVAFEVDRNGTAYILYSAKGVEYNKNCPLDTPIIIQLQYFITDPGRTNIVICPHA